MAQFLLRHFQPASKLFLDPDQQNRVSELDLDENKMNLDGCSVFADTLAVEYFPFHDRHNVWLILDQKSVVRSFIYRSVFRHEIVDIRSVFRVKIRSFSFSFSFLFRFSSIFIIVVY